MSVADEAREQVVELCRRMVARGLTHGTGGNASVRVGDLVAISPSGVPYDVLAPAQVPLVRLADGAPEGVCACRPSSELGMHRACYLARPEVACVVHTHSPFACTIAALGLSLPPVHYLVALAGDCVPCIPYHPFGTPELAAAAAAALGRDHNAVLLGNHGLLTCGVTPEAAASLAEEIEFCCEVYWRALAAGTPRTLDPDQVAHARTALAAYHQNASPQMEVPHVSHE